MLPLPMVPVHMHAGESPRRANPASRRTIVRLRSCAGSATAGRRRSWDTKTTHAEPDNAAEKKKKKKLPLAKIRAKLKARSYVSGTGQNFWVSFRRMDSDCDGVLSKKEFAPVAVHRGSLARRGPTVPLLSLSLSLSLFCHSLSLSLSLSLHLFLSLSVSLTYARTLRAF